MKVGFTGTRQGMTDAQHDTLETILTDLYKGLGVREWHDGDCVGADDEARLMVGSWPGVYIHSHPCNLFRQRAYNECDFEHEELPPLQRNKVIVDSVDVMIATPSSTEEQFRGSGTWATIRHARRTKTRLFIIWPDGTYAEEGDE